MTLIVLSAFAIGFLIVVVLLYLSLADVLRIRADKGDERLLAKSAAPVDAGYLDTAFPVPATAPANVGYLDEPASASDRAPAAGTAAPVGVGYLDV
ncbi:MAG TPA: hypothetical protein VFQ77_08925 [Pseudonocardiaceae bacterium]|nr:hypothetical protein [Pseudonocardiaceae bacterium]